MKIKEIATNELFNHVVEMIEEIERRRKETSDKHQYFDRKISDIYHKIETEKLTSERAEELTAELQYIFRLRRVVKRDRYIFDSIINFCNTDKDMDYSKSVKVFKEIGSQYCLSDGTAKSNDKWSNVEELGKVTYAMIDKEYDKKFGTLEDAMSKLEERVRHAS